MTVERAVMLLALLAALVGGYLWIRNDGVVAGRAEVQARWDAERATAQARTIQAERSARDEEERRNRQLQEVTDDATKQIARAHADAAAADRAADGLRGQLATFVHAYRSADASGDSSATGCSASAGDPIGVLADVLGRADQRAGELAAFADAAHVAGAACERAYDGVSGTPAPP